MLPSTRNAELLRLLSENKNENRCVNFVQLGVDRSRILELDRAGYVEALPLGHSFCVVLQETESALAELDEALEKERKKAAEKEAADHYQEQARAKERRQDRFDGYATGILCAVLGAMLALFVEHFDKILAFFASLLGLTP